LASKDRIAEAKIIVKLLQADATRRGGILKAGLWEIPSRRRILTGEHEQS